MNAIAERPNTQIAAAVTSEQMELVKRTVANGATADELKLYLYDCARQGVHPLDKLLHFTKRGGKYTPVTSIDLMRTRAADTGDYAGSDDAAFVHETGNGHPDEARVTVYRLVQGQRCAFTATARWSEYYPGDQSGTMWRKMPHTMLAKCAEALALRKGFPRQLAGLYAKEELDQADGDQRRAPVVTVDPPATVLDAATGAEVPASERPEPPAGYFYIDNYVFNAPWHEVTFKHFDDKGGAMVLSTKTTHGELAGQCYRDGVPVKIEWAPKKPARPGEGYLNKVEAYKVPRPELAPELLTAQDVGF